MAATMEQISLIRATIADVDFIVTLEADSENSTFIGRWPHERHRKNLDDPDFGYFVIAIAANAQRLGYVILEGLRDENRSLNIKRIVTTEKGRGIGRAAIRQIKNLAFREFGVHRLWLDVKTFNTRAKHVYETEGFKVEGTLRDCIKKADHGLIWMLLAEARAYNVV